MERLTVGVFRKSIQENLANIRAVLSHGKDPSLGSTVLGTIKTINETADSATARVELFPSVPQLLVEGLVARQYGASFRGEPVKNSVQSQPERSDHNPGGIPEITRLEIRLRDIGPTPFAAYAGTTAQIKGINDGVPPARAQRRDKQLAREELDPAWQLLNRRERRGHTYVKA